MGSLVPVEIVFRPELFLELFGTSPAGITIVIFSTVLLALIALRIIPTHSFTRDEAFLLLTANIIGLSLPTQSFNIEFFNLNDTTIYFNLVGAGLPLLIATYIVLKRKIDPASGVTAVILTAYVAFELGVFDSGKGVVIENFILLPLFAVMIAILLHGTINKVTAPLAYFSSVLGVIIGGDLVHLLLSLNTVSTLSAVSLGGTGVIDAVYMAGVLAITLDIAIKHYTHPDSTQIQTYSVEQEKLY